MNVSYRHAQFDAAGASASDAAVTDLAASRKGEPVPVHVIGVTKSYGSLSVLKPLNLDIAAGELISLLGPSGCGKTTTLRIIAGFIAPTTGTVRLGRRDVTDTPPYRRSLGMVFQAYSLFPHMTVAQNVEFGLRMQRIAASERVRRVKEMLQTVRLAGFEDRYPSQLSGGQQQRVATARALVTNPSVLLLDEPLGALDKNLREQMQFEVRDLQRKLGITTILVTHDQEEALTMSDRVAVMSHGELMQVGTPHEIYASPRNRFVSEFVGTSNLVGAHVVGRSQADRVIVSLNVNGEHVAVRCQPQQEVVTGQAVSIAVRPEKLAICAPSVGAMRVAIRNKTFRGTYYRYELAAKNLDVPLILFTREINPDWIADGCVGVDWRNSDAFLLGD